MAAPTGNQYWRLRWRTGRKLKIETPEKMLKLFFEYMDHIEENPLIGYQLVSYQGEASNHPVPYMRAGTIGGFCVHMGISYRQYLEYRKREDDGFPPVMEWIEEAMRTRKIDGAAAGLLNANIIARELGLVDKKDMTSDGESLAHISVSYDD